MTSAVIVSEMSASSIGLGGVMNDGRAPPAAASVAAEDGSFAKAAPAPAERTVAPAAAVAVPAINDLRSIRALA